MRRILVGINGTPESRRAAHIAANMAQAEGKEVVLAHVLPAVRDAGAFSAQYAVWRAQLAQRRKEEMEEIAQREARADTPLQIKLIDGDDAAQALARAADADEGIELVVVGHRARSRLARALGGSVADGLVQICGKPVLVVH